MSKSTTQINGLTVENITYKNPQNSLPKFVKEAAGERGYGDATQTLSLFVQENDVEEAFACAAQGNGSSCVMAQAGTRIGAKSVYFFRMYAWIDFGYGPIVRFATGKSIYDNVISPFDKGERERVKPGIYHLTPPSPSRTLSAQREGQKKYKESPSGAKKKVGNFTGNFTPWSVSRILSALSWQAESRRGGGVNLADRVTEANRKLLVAQIEEAATKYMFLAVIVADNVTKDVELGSFAGDYRYWRDRDVALRDEYKKKYPEEGKGNDANNRALRSGRN